MENANSMQIRLRCKSVKDAGDKVRRAFQLSIDEQKRLRELEGQRPER